MLMVFGLVIVDETFGVIEMAKKTKEKKAATRNTPLQIVKEQFG